MKNILVKFKMQIGEYECNDIYLFNKKKSDWGYCKEFWGIDKKDSGSLGDDWFWDNNMESAISVYFEKELNNKDADTLKQLGVVY